jgi:hypothetical protein
MEGKLRSEGKPRKKTYAATYGLREREDLLTGRGSNGLHSMENFLWKSLWTYRKTDCRMK